MIAVVDYGAGNLFSLVSSLRHIGADCFVTTDPGQLAAADSVILPGVGAFGNAMARLSERGMAAALIETARAGKPLLGICLGMQLLFRASNEYGRHCGLGLIDGEVTSLSAALTAAGRLEKVPHIGWNSLDLRADCPLLYGFRQGEFVYYVHSFFAPVGPYTAAASDYGVAVTGVAQAGNVFGCQFHPEKSGETGLRILRAFAALRAHSQGEHS